MQVHTNIVVFSLREPCPLMAKDFIAVLQAARRAFDSLQVRPFSLCECSLHLKCPPQVG